MHGASAASTSKFCDDAFAPLNQAVRPGSERDLLRQSMTRRRTCGFVYRNAEGSDFTQLVELPVTPSEALR